MLTRHALETALNRITYKPGFRFELFDHYEGLWLRITATVDDSTKQAELDLGIDVPVPPFDNVGQFHRWLLWRLTCHEIHESCEWFKVDGVAVFDPHQVTRWGYR